MTARLPRGAKPVIALLMLVVMTGVTMPALAQQTKTTVTYVYTNAQGTPLAEADAQGNIIKRYTYRPYGTQQSGPTNAGPGYTGHVHDPDTGLVYMQQRYYDPSTGRFISPDPVALMPGNLFNFGRYTYANDNPVRYTDPDGRCPKGVSSCVEPVPPSFFRDTGVGRFLASSVGNTVAIFTKNNINPLNDQYVGPNDIQDAKLGLLTLAVPASKVESAAADVLKPVLESAVKKSVVDIGEHAGESIPARSAARNFTKSERSEINRIGSETGCHSCGTTNPGTKSGNFVPDHQPPNAINPSGSTQRLYPQCINCSREQGLEIARRVRSEGK